MASVAETIVESMIRMVFGGKDFGKGLGHEGSLLNETSDLQEEPRDSYPSFSKSAVWKGAFIRT